MGKGKKSGDEVSARRLMVLEQICKREEGVSISDLKELIPDKYRVTEGTIKKDVEDLRVKIPIIEIKGRRVHAAPASPEMLWSDAPISERLAPSKSKIRLAQAVFLFIEQYRNQIGRLILGAGTTVYKCACELIRGASRLGNMRIHTANLLVLHEFVWHKPDNLYVELPGGELNLRTATLWSQSIAKYFKNVEAQAVITSFSGMSFEKGFCTAYHDMEEKLANLKPNPQTCKWIIIPIEWRRIARFAHIPVAESREEQLDFTEGERKYIIITDKPSRYEWNAGIDDEKLADLSKWKETYKDGIEIIYA